MRTTPRTSEGKGGQRIIYWGGVEGLEMWVKSGTRLPGVEDGEGGGVIGGQGEGGEDQA